ncbi:unnamed protein product, partial [Protopolystoma xenopodis]
MTFPSPIGGNIGQCFPHLSLLSLAHPAQVNLPCTRLTALTHASGSPFRSPFLLGYTYVSLQLLLEEVLTEHNELTTHTPMSTNVTSTEGPYDKMLLRHSSPTTVVRHYRPEMYLPCQKFAQHMPLTGLSLVGRCLLPSSALVGRGVCIQQDLIATGVRAPECICIHVDLTTNALFNFWPVWLQTSAIPPSSRRLAIRMDNTSFLSGPTITCNGPAQLNGLIGPDQLIKGNHPTSTGTGTGPDLNSVMATGTTALTYPLTSPPLCPQPCRQTLDDATIA